MLAVTAGHLIPAMVPDDPIMRTLVKGLEHRGETVRTVLLYFTLEDFYSPEMRREVAAAGNSWMLPDRGASRDEILLGNRRPPLAM